MTCLILGLLAATVLMAADNSVSGTLTIQGKSFPLRYIYAQQVPGAFDKTKAATLVVLTDQPVPVEARTDVGDLMDLYSSGKLNGIKLEYGEDGSSVSVILMSNLIQGSVSLSRSGSHITPRIFTPRRIEGEMSVKPDSVSSTHYSFDVKFAADIAPRLIEPEPTPQETAAAQKAPSTLAYLALVKAIHAGDKAGIMAAVNPEARAMVDTPDFPEILKAVQAMTPKKVKILRAFEKDGLATLTATGVDPDGKTTRGKIRLKLDSSGKWYMLKESWGE